MRVVADSHAIFWHLQRCSQLSEPAAEALREAGASDGITVSVATLLDLWYVTQTTRAVTVDDLARVRATPSISLQRTDEVAAPLCLDALKVVAPALVREDQRFTREIGETAHEQGFQAIRSPSATGADHVLAILPENLAGRSCTWSGSANGRRPPT